MTSYVPAEAPHSQLGDLATMQRVPEVAKTRLRQIEAVCLEGLEFGRRGQVVQEEALRRLVTIRDVETPNVVAAWLELPPGTVLDTPQGPRSADEELVDQLGLLLGAAQEAHAAALDGSRLQMTIESVYLRDKYDSG